MPVRQLARVLSRSFLTVPSERGARRVAKALRKSTAFRMPASARGLNGVVAKPITLNRSDADAVLRRWLKVVLPSKRALPETHLSSTRIRRRGYSPMGSG
jgi:hypothetical protein